MKLLPIVTVLAALTACTSTTLETNSAAPELSHSKAEPLASLNVSNPSLFARDDVFVHLSLNQLGVPEGQSVQVWAGSQAVPTQMIDNDGDGNYDDLAFLTRLAASETKSFTIDTRLHPSAPLKRTQAEVSIKQDGEWQDKKYLGGTFKNVNQVTPPAQYTDHSEYIRYEGPGIESDKIGYRVYLDWRNGFDIFGKKTDKMVLQDVGQDGYQSYHEMADWGADILKVGSSLGAGGYGYWNGSEVVLVSETGPRSVAIDVNGPLYSAMTIDYSQWNTGDQIVDMSAGLSMRAGSPIVDVNLSTSEPLDNIAVGLVAHPDTELITGDLDITGEAWSYVASIGKQSLFDDTLGMFLLFKKRDFLEQTRDKSSYVVVLKPRGNTLQYAFGALWEGGHQRIQNRADLLAFLNQEVERRTLAPRIQIVTEKSKQALAMSPTTIAVNLADSEITRRGDSLIYGKFDDVRERRTQWTYTTGLLMESLDDVSQLTGEPRFSTYAKSIMDSYLGDDEPIKGYRPENYNIDDINSGKMIQRLYARTSDAKYRAAIDALATTLETHPRTSDGAYWHKKRYPHQLWLDGVYMGMPFLAGVGNMQSNPHKVEAAAHEFIIARERLRDPQSGLYYHAWDEVKQQVWADSETGRSKYFWSRGLGWYAMALVDILDVIPAERAELREPLLAMIPELADSLLKYQDESGAWYQITDMPDATGNYLEASGTAMFTYFLAKAVNQGYLPSSYQSAAEKAYNGLVTEFISIDANGHWHLDNICEVAGLGFGRDGSYHYYMSERLVSDDPKGYGPAIMAVVQIAKLLNSKE
ncbi:hypothetical protein GCM10008090_02450 [Arenicella chitinivorans]|uniref:Rhamnogalacturonyl hydrolase YesR n=1 Tax=Arenicella chitinivorans TaxID=1329800 RepID=A0A918RH05_9GAMM|nr:glycoside hydrolase family 88 protein [Arenicella chitinivorans]GGZ97654.1 hypothetical protein GCM10008090_02450 [Arenicella chitinivorans]